VKPALWCGTALAAGIIALAAADWALPPHLARYQTTSTEVLARDGSLLRAFPVQGGIWRLRTSVADVDSTYLNLLIAAEDQRFRSHSGIDPGALFRALTQDLRARRIVSGGSTLTMQVARLLEPHPRGVAGKLHDLVRALQLEQRYSKDQILDMYLTLAPMGGNLEGVRAASLAYFNEEPSHLSLDQSLALIALPQSPARRRPDRHFAALTQSRSRLAARLHLATWANPAAPITRHPMPMLAAAFAAGLARNQALSARIISTIDPTRQRAMEALVARELADLDPKVGIGLVMVDNQTREIRALIGSRGLTYPAGFLDLTRAERSPGSALKPFIYGMAFDQGILHPQTLIADAPGRIAGYAPRNFDSLFHGDTTAETALQQSYNVPAVQVLARIGAGNFVATLRQAGARIALPRGPANLAVALGGEGIDLRDLTMLYAALADDGLARPLQSQPEPAQPGTQFMGERAVYYLRQILQGSPPPPGMVYAQITGLPAIAFKTGTSFGYRDALAIGYSDQTTIGVWLGRVEGSPRPGAFGRNTAAPIMLDAFSQLPAETATPRSPPSDILLADSTSELPSALQRFGTAPQLGPRLSYPPNGSTVDLLKTAAGFAPITLRAEAGHGILRWIINGIPQPTPATEFTYTPDGPGFVQIQIIDANDRATRSSFRLE